MRLNKMKKLQAMVIASSAALALCACGSSVTDVAKSTEMSMEQETTSKSDVKQTEAAEKKNEQTSADDSATTKKKENDSTKANEIENFQQNFKKASYKELTDTLVEIDTDIRLGTAGSSLVSTKVAAHLLNWGVGTTLTTDEIKQKTKEWLSAKSGSQVTEFSKKFDSVYASYKALLGPDAKKLLDEAGCQDAAYPWSDSPVDTIEAINDCL